LIPIRVAAPVLVFRENRAESSAIYRVEDPVERLQAEYGPIPIPSGPIRVVAPVAGFTQYMLNTVALLASIYVLTAYRPEVVEPMP
jgi:hypothetical protein